MSGRVVHFEIPYDDGDRARRFYKETFGWQLQEMPGMEYTLVVSGPERRHRARASRASSTAACSRGRRARHRGPVVVIDVPSIDEALQTIERLGGTHRRPQAAGRRDGLHRLREGPRGQRHRPLGDRAAGLTRADQLT